MNNNWYKEHTPFYLEVEFNKLNDNTQFALLDASINGKEILPGLKVNKCYNQITDADTILTSELNEDFNVLLKTFRKFSEKWNRKLNEHKVDKTVQIEGETNTLSDKEKSNYIERKNKQVVNDYSKNKMEGEWIEMNGNQTVFPDMIF